MKEIKCPNCGQVFQVDESGYEQIVKQVRDKEFTKELNHLKTEYSEKLEADIELAKLNQEKEFQEVLTTKNQELSDKDHEISELRLQISGKDTELELAITKAVQEKERELSEKNNEVLRLSGQLANKEAESELKEKSIKEKYEIELRQKDEQIEYYKDFKARQSTKMVGESLEQHCLNQFNMLRAAAFPNAYFEKDNDAKTGSKGDFIFRESDEDGTEFISIMFEMKNETDTTSTKHKNEDFFRELDKDRREKGCEYAILVSLLEIDNELYNSGIVDVSHKYEKMYVIRPQFFIPMITLLRNAARNSLEYQRELQIVRNQQVDILHFEENMEAFKKGFANNYRLASEKFEKAIAEIDKTIDHLQKTKTALLGSANQLRLANNKADALSIKRLTKNAPTVKEMFDSISKSDVS